MSGIVRTIVRRSVFSDVKVIVARQSARPSWPSTAVRLLKGEFLTWLLDEPWRHAGSGCRLVD